MGPVELPITPTLPTPATPGPCIPEGFSFGAEVLVNGRESWWYVENGLLIWYTLFRKNVCS